MFCVDLLPRGQKAPHTHIYLSVVSVHRLHFIPHNMWVEMSVHKKPSGRAPLSHRVHQRGSVGCATFPLRGGSLNSSSTHTPVQR
jgi:hypothetical protein